MTVLLLQKVSCKYTYSYVEQRKRRENQKLETTGNYNLGRIEAVEVELEV